MDKKLIYIVTAMVVILFAAVGFYYLTNGYRTGTTKNANTQTISTNSVSIKDFAFSPADIKVAKGSTVTWTNDDTTTHSLRSDIFESQNLNQGDQYTFTFVNIGKYNYHCSLHPSMTGTVTVE